MNDVLDAMVRRSACRAFLPTPVPADTLATIAEAGLHSPSAVDRQPWRIICVTDQGLLHDIEIAGLGALRTADPAGADRIASRGGRLLYGAPAVMMLVEEPIEGPYGPDLDVGILAAHIALAAQSLGVNSCIAAMPGVALSSPAGPDLRRRLHVPDGFRFGLSVLLGYADGPVKQPHEIDPAKVITIA
ncbi:MAG: nitroreductase family protein [Propionibacteriaceae bacterium]|nr:nitroreductase family protein [Propionibacteriaceae bacterium]